MRLPRPRRREKRPNSQMRSRIAVLIILLSFLGFAAVGVRLFWMQVVRYDYYTGYALQFQTKDSVIAPKRGTIYDRNMKVLAESASTESVMINPTRLVDFCNENKIDKEDAQEQIADILAENLDMVHATVLGRVQREQQLEVLIKGGVEKDIVEKINTQLAEAEMGETTLGAARAIYTNPDTKRYYPYSSFAAQTIGFLNESGAVGGVELKYDEILSGTSGRIVRAQNARNADMPFEYEQYIPAEDGGAVVLTIDETIQHYLEKHLETGLADNPAARGGLSGIVMDIKTGEILGMAGVPDFDINAYSLIEKDSLYYNELAAQIEEFLTEIGIEAAAPEEYLTRGLMAALPEGLTETQRETISAMRIEKLQNMWRNNIVSDTYEPGSTFKLMTVATALEAQAIQPDDHFHCSGSMKVAGWPRPIRCHKAGGHGSLTLTEALTKSCNVAMMQIAFKTGAETFYDFFEAFGLTSRTGIDLPGEQKPAGSLYYSKEDLVKTPSNLAVASFGQRFQVTPLQMINMVAAIVDDGNLKTPHIVQQVLGADGSVQQTMSAAMQRQVISAETSAFMRDAMEAVVTEGTGQNAYVAGYRVGGKTATSEITKRPDDVEDRYTASFIGVAPMDDPQIAVLVAIQDLPHSAPHGGGAQAAPVVGRILTDALPYLGIEPLYDESEVDRRELEVPSVIGHSREDAEKAMKDAGLEARFIGEEDRVTDQVPSGGVKIPAAGQALIYLGGEKSAEMITVPNVLGEHPTTTKARLEALDLYMRRAGIKTSKTNGQTRAMQQHPVAGAQVPVGTVITVSFENTTGVNDYSR